MLLSKFYKEQNLSDQTRVTYRVSWKSVQPFSSDAGPNRQTDRQTDTQTHRHTDRQTKKNLKNVVFVFSALNYTCWYDLFLKNRKLQEIFGLQIYIYIYKDIDIYYQPDHWSPRPILVSILRYPNINDSVLTFRMIYKQKFRTYRFKPTFVNL